jgi:dihydrolipoamide dehydrogenase
MTGVEGNAMTESRFSVAEEEVYHAMHPHLTYSEATMDAAGQGLGESVPI